MPHKFPAIGTAVPLLLFVTLAVPAEASETDRAVAELFAPENSNSIPEIVDRSGGLESSEVIPEVFDTGSGDISADIWAIIQAETGLKDFNIGDESALEDIWNVASSTGELPDYGSVFGNDGGWGDYGSGVITNFTGDADTFPSFPDSGRTPPIVPNGDGATTRTIFNGGIPDGGQTPPIVSDGGIPDIGNTLPDGASGDGGIFSGGGLPTIFGGGGASPTASGGNSSASINPFRWIAKWSQENIVKPLMKAFGISGNKTRTPFKNEAVGVLTRNSVVQKRDQANMLSQELARMMAEPRLGVEGEAWMKEESEQAMQVLNTGIEQINAAVKLSADAQSLTSTQDVAKAVAEISGHNAQTIGASLQLQTQSQAALLQLQQLAAAGIELDANISEALDEANRRERLERDSVFAENAGETLYLRGIWSTTTTP